MKTVWIYFAKEAQGDEKSDLIIFDKAIQLPDSAQPWQMISFRFSRASSSSKSSPAFELL